MGEAAWAAEAGPRRIDDYGDAASVLVCVVTRPSDMELARRCGWYRIPVARAPRRMAADLLAFYQTAVFGAGRWSVRVVAPVRAVRVVARAELLPGDPSHPRAAERYYRIELGELEDLRAPVPSRRLRRISFIPTTLGALRRARDVAELWRAAERPEPPVWGAGIGRRAVRG